MPVGFVGWAEALGCDHFYKAIGGHVWCAAAMSAAAVAVASGSPFAMAAAAWAAAAVTTSAVTWIQPDFNLDTT